MIYLLLGTSVLTEAPSSSNFREKHCFPLIVGVAYSFRMLVFTCKTIQYHLDIHHSENTESQDNIKCRNDALL